jgi:serine/threonine protein kinase
VSPPNADPTIVDRYHIHDTIGTGGMATVHLGRFVGPGSFARTVAIKRMHPHLAKQQEFVAMFLDEARLAARIRHPNVVSTLDVVAKGDELLIVMEYVHGASLGSLARVLTERRARTPVPIACAIVADFLAGLHAAHEARDEGGQPLHIVHRDVSPQNVLVGADGVSRVLDFGVAKAVGRLQQTRDGEVKGKVAYMAPEQVRSKPITRATDIYAASVVLWEALTGRRLFQGQQDAVLIERILFGTIDAPSARAPSIPEALNAIVLRGLSREPADRFGTAREMVRAMRDCVRLASASEVGDWLEGLLGDQLADRAAAVAAIDLGSQVTEVARLARSSLVSVRVRASQEEAAIILPSEAVGAVDTVLGKLLTVRTPPTAAKGSRRPRLWLPIGALLAGVLAVVGVRASNGPRAVAVPSPSASLQPSASPSDLPAPAPPPSNEPVALAPVPEAGSPASTSSRPGPVTPRPTHSRPVRTDCSPPYTTDSDGTRHYKLQCL